MTARFRSLSFLVSASVVVLSVLAGVLCAATGIAGPPLPVVRAFYLKTVPDTYAGQEKLFSSFKNTGINTVIAEVPLTSDGYPNTAVVPNLAFLAHREGVKLQVVLSTRSIPGPIAEHDDWEDRAYDLNTDSYRSTGKLDLFNAAAVNYLTDVAGEIASYSVDGILLGSDFTYAPLEGMSRTAASFASGKLNASIEPARMYTKLGKGPEGRFIQEYSVLYQKWAALKRDRLLTVFEKIRSVARRSNKTASVGVTIPITYPMATPSDLFSRFSFAVDEYRKRDADYYLAQVDYRDLQDQKNLSYQQAAEAVSQVSRSLFAMVKDGRRIIVVLPMTERLTAKPLRQSETEEVYGLVRSAGNLGAAFIIKNDTDLNRNFTSLLFKK